MPSFGENLRREREKRNITLDQISQSTKIGSRMLQALEEDKFSQLPGGIFNKGFVRAYARFVGLDEDQTVADYLQASGESQPVLPEIPVEQPQPRIEASVEPSPQRQTPWGMFAALLLLAALALSLWSRRQERHEDAARPTTAPAVRQPGETAQPLAATSAATLTATSTSPAPSAAGSAAVAPQPGEFVVVVHARANSWASLTSDGKPAFSGILSSGDQRAVRGRKEVVVKVGNAGGIDLFLNGTPLPHAGTYGDVRSITIGPGGILPNRPSPSPVP